METLQKEGDAPVLQMCSNCDVAAATVWCLDCNGGLCDNCELAHRRVSLTRNHRLHNRPPKAETPAVSERCNRHPLELLEIVCLTCKTFTCRDCQLASHMNHRYEFASRCMADVKKSMMLAVEPIRAQAETLSQSLRDMETRLEFVEKSKSHLHTDLLYFFTMLAKNLKNKLKLLLDEITDKCVLESERIHQRKETLQQLQHNQRLILEASQKGQSSTQFKDVLVEWSKMKKHLNILQNQDLSPPSTMSHFLVWTQNETDEIIEKLVFVETGWIPFAVPQEKVPKNNNASSETVDPTKSSESESSSLTCSSSTSPFTSSCTFNSSGINAKQGMSTNVSLPVGELDKVCQNSSTTSIATTNVSNKTLPSEIYSFSVLGPTPKTQFESSKMDLLSPPNNLTNYNVSFPQTNPPFLSSHSLTSLHNSGSIRFQSSSDFTPQPGPITSISNSSISVPDPKDTVSRSIEVPPQREVLNQRSNPEQLLVPHEAQAFKLQNLNTIKAPGVSSPNVNHAPMELNPNVGQTPVQMPSFLAPSIPNASWGSKFPGSNIVKTTSVFYPNNPCEKAAMDPRQLSSPTFVQSSNAHGSNFATMNVVKTSTVSNQNINQGRVVSSQNVLLAPKESNPNVNQSAMDCLQRCVHARIPNILRRSKVPCPNVNRTSSVPNPNLLLKQKWTFVQATSERSQHFVQTTTYPSPTVVQPTKALSPNAASSTLTLKSFQAPSVLNPNFFQPPFVSSPCVVQVPRFLSPNTNQAPQSSIPYSVRAQIGQSPVVASATIVNQPPLVQASGVPISNGVQASGVPISNGVQTPSVPFSNLVQAPSVPCSNVVLVPNFVQASGVTCQNVQSLMDSRPTFVEATGVPISHVVQPSSSNVVPALLVGNGLPTRSRAQLLTDSAAPPFNNQTSCYHTNAQTLYLPVVPQLPALSVYTLSNNKSLCNVTGDSTSNSLDPFSLGHQTVVCNREENADNEPTTTTVSEESKPTTRESITKILSDLGTADDEPTSTVPEDPGPADNKPSSTTSEESEQITSTSDMGAVDKPSTPEIDESGVLIGHQDFEVKLIDPHVSLLRIPLSNHKPGGPLPSFRVVIGENNDQIYLKEMDETETLTSPTNNLSLALVDLTDSMEEMDQDCVIINSIPNSPIEDGLDLMEPLIVPESPISLEVLSCSVCMSSESLIICSVCARGFHRNCHIPEVKSFSISNWNCSLCRDPSDSPDQRSYERTTAPEDGLSLQDQRKCVNLLLFLKVQDCVRLSKFAGAAQLQQITNRLLLRHRPYPDLAHFISDVSVMFNTSQAGASKALKQRFLEKLEQTFGSGFDWSPLTDEPEAREKTDQSKDTLQLLKRKLKNFLDVRKSKRPKTE